MYQEYDSGGFIPFGLANVIGFAIFFWCLAVVPVYQWFKSRRKR